MVFCANAVIVVSSRQVSNRVMILPFLSRRLSEVDAPGGIRVTVNLIKV